MKKLFCIVCLFISSCAIAQEMPQIEKAVGGMGQEIVPNTYELYYNGENVYLELNRPKRLAPVATPKDGKTLFSLRFSPFQQAEMDTFKFRYPYPARAFDDKSAGQHVIRIYNPKGYAIFITDFGAPLANKEDTAKALTILEEVIKEQFKGKQENPEIVTAKFSPKLDNAVVDGTRVMLRLRYPAQAEGKEGETPQPEQNKIYETIGMTVSNDDFFATVVIQMFDNSFSKEIQDNVIIMLKSFEAK